MGSRLSIQPQTQQWRSQEWQNLPQHPQNFGKTATLRNLRTGALADEYQLGWHDEQDYQFYLKSFNWRCRRRNPGPIINSIGIIQLGSNGFCSQRWVANVYLQHIGVRLSQIEDIPIGDSLYILQESLCGYEQLYSHAGYFRVQQQQICLQRSGRVKVWVNSNLSKNYPEIDSETQCLRRDETHMVRQLVDIIESNTDPDELPQQSFSSFLQDIRRREGCHIGFERAQVAVLDYAKAHQILISNRIETAVQLYHLTETRITLNNLSIQQKQTTHKVQRLISSPQLQSYHSSPNLHRTVPLTIYPSSQSYSQGQIFNTFQSQESQNTQITKMRLIQTQPSNTIIPSSSLEEQLHIDSAVDPPESTGKNQRTSRPTTNTRSYLANIEQTSEHYSLNMIDESHERSLGGSQRGPFSVNNPRQNDWIRYSQNIEDNYTQYDFNSFKFNRDTFGLAPQRRFMKESTSSYRVPSSNNSSRSPGGRSRRSYRSSRKQSGKGSSRRSQMLVQKWQADRNHYYVGMGDYSCLDPQIAADIAKYLG